MAEKLTQQQLQAVTDRGGKLLVSAAAGSGKTKVLVDRLLSYLTDSAAPANLDEFLIITYTKAAAAELRGKIADKLTQRIAENPDNRHLQKQVQCLYLAKISTVHSFCADILREYAYQLDISADFRVADENECLELQMRAIEQTLDDAYESAEQNSDFCAFVDSQGLGRDDRMIPQILLKVYRSARCHLEPDKWLDWCICEGNNSQITDASETVWGSFLIEDLHAYLDLQIEALNRCACQASNAEEMQKPAELLYSTLDQLAVLRKCSTWDSVRANMDIDYGRLVFSKKCTDDQLIQKIKAVRTACKKGVANKLRRFSDDSAQVLMDMTESLAATRGLVDLVKKFSQAYDKLKRSRNLLNFSDLEHKMLDLLLGKSRTGRTRISTEIGQRFREVMVDEYQDSNTVQEAIFGALTFERQNCFMVGDVKQSIYQFRLADPTIFMEKYNTYSPADGAKPGQGRKVLLSSNFRSSGGVIKAVNDVFSTCMSPKVGGLTYGEEEVLREGIDHCALDEPEVELYGIDVQTDTYAEEAAFTAHRIAQLLDGTHMVRQGNVLRPILPDDIVILLRSPGSVGGEFQWALEQRGIRCTTGGNADLLQTEEVQTLRSLLQVISNPLQDIPLIAVLTSRLFAFTADDLAAFRGGNRNVSLFAALKSCNTPKAKAFLKTLSLLRREAQLDNLSQLLMSIFTLTRIDSIFAAMSDGNTRVENLQSFCQIVANFENAGPGGLNRLLQHLEAMEEKGLVSPNERKNSGAVTIMSIHKSKGLEFSVVFLCGLSREFNREDVRAQVLCDKELGLGLACVDSTNRIRYPSIAKRAIAAKILSQSLSEEMRVLYVAMTRARDRLIMTYAQKNIEQELEDILLRMDDTLLLTQSADCPGLWVLLTALKRSKDGWSIKIIRIDTTEIVATEDCWISSSLPASTLEKLKDALSFRYAHLAATTAPSKQTATQLKGRNKDLEAAEDTIDTAVPVRPWREPSYKSAAGQGRTYGNAMHAVMQYICFEACTDNENTQREIKRLVDEKYISSEQGNLVNAQHISNFFASDIGRRLQTPKNILREFKFSILDDAKRYCSGVENEEILLQGVVDCALIEDDGITVIDFKTDRVTEETLPAVIQKYRGQLEVYCNALTRIYQMPIKSAQLYFFNTNTFVAIL